MLIKGGFRLKNYYYLFAMENMLQSVNGYYPFKDAAQTALFNPLNAELNPICHLLALLEAHHFLNVSRIRVKNPDRTAQ